MTSMVPDDLILTQVSKCESVDIRATAAPRGDVRRANSRTRVQNEPVIPEPTRPQLDVAARTFALLGAPVRLHLVALVAQGAYDVGTLSDRVGVNIATASQHLTKLRLAGLISAHSVRTLRSAHTYEMYVAEVRGFCDVG